MNKYVSPMVRARDIAAGRVAASKWEVKNAKRMVRLPPMIIVDLEREEAPVHVFRWVAWGANHTDQRHRMDLVTHLRRSIERPRNGWYLQRHFVVALAEWNRVRSEARKRGGIMPAAHQIPLDVYRTAIDGAQKAGRAQSPAPETAALVAEIAAECGEPAEDEPADELEEDEEEVEPISARQILLQGRDHVLRLLSDAVRAALAAQDMEAADVANDAISRLCGGRAAVG